MRISIESETTVGDLLKRARARYGTLRELRAHVKENPDDVAARVALHDLVEYRRTDPRKRVTETRDIVLSGRRLNQLTMRRLEMLLALQGLGEAASVRRLAQALCRDVKNVSADVAALRKLGLLKVEASGRGRPSRVRLPGQRVDLHLVEPDAPRRVRGARGL